MGKKTRLGSDPLEMTGPLPWIRDTRKENIIVKDTERKGRRDKSYGMAHSFY